MSSERGVASRLTGSPEPASVMRELLAIGNDGGPRAAFLRRVSMTLLQTTGAHVLDIWLEKRDLRYRWRVEARPRLAIRISALPSGDGQARPILEEVLAILESAGVPLERASSVGRDGRWMAAGGAGAREGHPDWSLDQPSWVLLPFSVDEHDDGVLRLASDSPGFFTESSVQTTSTLGWALGAALASRRAHAAVTERVKELTCMYAIARVSAEQESPLPGKLRRIVELLPPAWQYPSVATARITLDGEAIVSSGFAPGPHRLAADIVVRGALRGQVEVFYLDRGDDLDLLSARPFLPEERTLIQSVATAIASLVEAGIAEDERTALREQVRSAERLATIGQLAAGVAHELNEPLGNVLGFAQLALKAPDLSPQPRQDLQKIVDAALLAREIITQLLYFARQQPPRRARLELGGVVRSVLSLMESRSKLQGVRVISSVAGDDIVDADPSQMHQVLVNLVVNALHAMPQGGVLSVRTALDDGDVVLDVADTGVGMSPEVRSKVFTPFFTTKEVGRGTGLGLSVVHGIVEAHGGHIEVESEEGCGTTFRVRLPRGGGATA